MPASESVAFFSYVRSDDDHDAGQISNLRSRLEGEVKIQTGIPLHIFQDRNDIRWGQQWKERIEDALLGVTFLIPVLTPSYFKSPACRKEFETFLTREKALGEERLILPIYYVACEEMEPGFDASNQMAAVLRSRNWADWRSLRFETPTSVILRATVAELATTIKVTIKELERVFAASAGERIPPQQLETSADAPKSSHSLLTYRPQVLVARGKKFDSKHYAAVTSNPYYTYTSKFDEVITPSEVSEPADTMKLHSYLSGFAREDVTAHEIEIASATEKLSKIAKTERLSATFLIDCSGSMRGVKIRNVASWMSIISSILANVNIPCEILGFTTRTWKGGLSRELWLKDGKPAAPGRLNDLRHIIFKSFDETSQEADINIAVMLREGLLKENIDGEALLWAYSRIEKSPASRRLLFVISDGASVDDSTLSVNASNFLESHAIATADWIKHHSAIELYGIGIEHDVSRFYGKGCPTLDSARFGPDLLSSVTLAISHEWPLAAAIQPTEKPPLKTKKAALKTGKTVSM